MSTRGAGRRLGVRAMTVRLAPTGRLCSPGWPLPDGLTEPTDGTDLRAALSGRGERQAQPRRVCVHEQLSAVGAWIARTRVINAHTAPPCRLGAEGVAEPLYRSSGGLAGRETHWRVRWDVSTALMISCTRALWAKLPWFSPAPERISSQKLCTRFA